MRKRYEGDVLNTTIKDRTKILIDQHDLDAYDVGYLFGRCRELTKSKASYVTATEKRKYYENTLDATIKLQELVSNMPQDIECELSEFYYFQHRRTVIMADLERTLEEFTLAVKLMSPTTLEASKAGERNKNEEKSLLMEVSTLLEAKGIAKLKSADYAVEILTSEGFINIPTETKKARGAIINAIPLR